MMLNKHEKHAIRAYFLWEREGRPEGRELDHWFRTASIIHNDLVDDIETLKRAYNTAQPIYGWFSAHHLYGLTKSDDFIRVKREDNTDCWIFQKMSRFSVGYHLAKVTDANRHSNMIAGVISSSSFGPQYGDDYIIIMIKKILSLEPFLDGDTMDSFRLFNHANVEFDAIVHESIHYHDFADGLFSFKDESDRGRDPSSYFNSEIEYRAHFLTGLRTICDRLSDNPQAPINDNIWARTDFIQWLNPVNIERFRSALKDIDARRSEIRGLWLPNKHGGPLGSGPPLS